VLLLEEIVSLLRQLFFDRLSTVTYRISNNWVLLYLGLSIPGCPRDDRFVVAIVVHTLLSGPTHSRAMEKPIEMTPMALRTRCVP